LALRLFLLRGRRHPPSSLLPYTTLFRSPSPGVPCPARSGSRSRTKNFPSGTPCARVHEAEECRCVTGSGGRALLGGGVLVHPGRSEEHTSELQSRENLVCRLLLEKKHSQ